MRTAQAWTRLAQAWNDVRATGLWLLRATPAEARRRFPSLIANVRAPTRKPRAKKDASKTPAEGESTTTQGATTSKSARRKRHGR